MSLWNEFLSDIETRRLICYGAGMMPYYIDMVLERSGVLEKIECFTDGDPKKHGGTVDIGSRAIPVVSLENVLYGNLSECVFLITAEYFGAISERLEGAKWYAWPQLNYEYFQSLPEDDIKTGGELRIPKTIHWFWVGSVEIPEHLQICIDSWKRFCPDFDIVRWDESNYDVTKCRYMEQAYKAKKWAMVSDYARLDIVYEHGGVYFDADVELIAPIDDMLCNKAFFSYAEWPCVNTGVGFGAVPGLEIIREMRDEPRVHIDFINPDGSYNMTTNGKYESDVLVNYGFRKDFTYQERKGVVLYPPDYFASDSKLGRDIYVTERTRARHHCSGTWRT